MTPASGLPVLGAKRYSRSGPLGQGAKRHLLIGGSGVVGTVLSEGLVGQEQDVTVLDPIPSTVTGVDWCEGTALDSAVPLQDLVDASDYVAFLATGANSGWAGLVDVEIFGCKQVIDCCINSTSVRRLFLASTNHVSGGYELDSMSGHPAEVPDATSPLRPDGLYGAAKAFAEAVARTASELHHLPVSVLRIGTMRGTDSPEAEVESPLLEKFGGPDEIRIRLEKSWLYHSDFVRIYIEEITAPETFRLRFGTSNPGALRDGRVLTWSPPK